MWWQLLSAVAHVFTGRSPGTYTRTHAEGLHSDDWPNCTSHDTSLEHRFRIKFPPSQCLKKWSWMLSHEPSSYIPAPPTPQLKFPDENLYFPSYNAVVDENGPTSIMVSKMQTRHIMWAILGDEDRKVLFASGYCGIQFSELQNSLTPHQRYQSTSKKGQDN